MRRHIWVQPNSGVGWKRTSKYAVVSEVLEEAAPPSTEATDGVGYMDIRMRAIESAGMSYAEADTGFNEITRSAFSNMARSKTTSG